MEKPDDEIEDRRFSALEGSEKDPVFQLCDLIREVSYAIHQFLHNGHPEKVYENALAHRLRKQGIKVIQQHPIKVYDEDGTLLGSFAADLLVEDMLIIELKACATLLSDHKAQDQGYLRASRIEHGLLINFGSPKLEVKKLYQSLKEFFAPFCPFCFPLVFIKRRFIRSFRKIGVDHRFGHSESPTET
ncbi:GxxExxY protein [candidate division KSB1 bacterium]|nr:GxxExxY protein [candidate division KSB1 bacterium]